MAAEFTPNPEQQELIDTTEGVVRVDAGAGTGKTFAVTRRYAKILDQPDISPDDILLVTFTNNAATEMRDRIVRQSDAAPRDLKDAPIQTFHSFCHDVLLEYGYRAPSYLGLDHGITQATRVLEDETIERERFASFFCRFRDDHPEHDSFYPLLDDPTTLLGCIKELSAKGVFPTAEGWYRDGADHLTGDESAFREIFEERNRPRNGGSKQSELRQKLNSYGRNKTYRQAAPSKQEIRGERTKQVPAGLPERVFEQDRDALRAFIHDCYFEYLDLALRRNELNFGFLQGLAYVLLCDDHALRAELAFEYVMIDEFQDTSEIQFQLGLLLSDSENLCVVGDWKQSIYSFQYADVENITHFEDRMQRFSDALNQDHERVSMESPAVQDIELTRNYRSTQRILDFAESSLTVPASNSETVDVDTIEDRIEPLEAVTDRDHSRIEAFQHEDEQAAILTKIQGIVDNDAYRVEGDDGELRPPTLDDITVLTRTREFGRELLATAETYDVPLTYEGDVELLRSDQAKLVLAWLRILDGDQDEGWAVVLERAGYTLDEIAAILDPEAREQQYPEEMATFRDELATLESVGGTAEAVLHRYGFDGEYADQLLHTIQSIYDGTTMSRGDLIQYIERGIDDGATHHIHSSAGDESVLVQTIHATKGLEHPIVILANMNRHQFPPSGRGSGGPIRYRDPIGVRQTSVYAEDHGQPFVYDDWRYDVLRMTLPREYDEERRLLYVAITRAEHHLLLSAGEKPNQFLEELPVDVAILEPDVEQGGPGTTEQAHLQITVLDAYGPRSETPHTIMDDSVFEQASGGLGSQFGDRVHEFAEDYARGRVTDPPAMDEPDCENVSEFIDNCHGTLFVEQPAHLHLDVAGESVTINGVVDLVHITEDSVEVIDYKTDRGSHAQSEYEIQLSIYYHVLSDAYPDREVNASIYYTAKDEPTDIDPLDIREIEDAVATRWSR